jgi:hypothetical protein
MSLKKIAVCVGINKYPNPRNNLRGCVPDAKKLRSIFLKWYNFDKVILLLDKKATYRNVTEAIKNAMLDLNDYGHFVFTTSSHGTTIPDRSGDEIDKRDEAICLYDRLLVDDKFRSLIDHAPVGMKATIITDCCHSGSITRGAYMRNFSSGSGPTYMKPRYLPPEDDEFAVSARNIPVRSKMFASSVEEADMREVLITGCKSNEYSYDARFGRSYHGALTYNMIQILNHAKRSNLTYSEFYKLLRDRLPSANYPQTPQLEGSKENKNTIMFS